MSRIMHFAYRPEIDGLRALAVVAVVLFHAKIGCPGGFVGVDVFFVISGYLITSLIWKDLEQGTFTLVGFWERRARRIIPPAIAVTMATLLAGFVLMNPVDFTDLGLAAICQSFGLANFYYWRDSGYFTPLAEERPLLHTWSLAVEEQFYMVAPFLLYWAFHTDRWRNRVSLISFCSIGILSSLILSIDGTNRYPLLTFFLLPTRAWELLLGSLIAFLTPTSMLLKSRSLRELIALAGIALILFPIYSYTQLTRFPGAAALLPCGGTALFIWANTRSEGGGVPTTIGAVLALRPVVFVGLISYSLYLWHWPVLAFAKYFSPGPLSFGWRVVAMGLSFLLAVVSWKYIETPFRERKLAATGKSIFTFTGWGVAAIAGFGLLCVAMRGFPQRLNPEVLEIANARLDRPEYRFLEIDDIQSGKLVPIGAKNSVTSPAVLIWGDSHAHCSLPAFDKVLEKQGIAGLAAIRPGTCPVLGWCRSHDAPADIASAIAFNQAVFEYAEQQQFSDVYLIARWRLYSPEGYYPEEFNSSLVKTVRQLVSIGVRTWVVLDVPVHSFDVPKALSLFTASAESIAAVCDKPSSESAFDGFDPRVIAEIKSAGGRLLDPKPGFLDPTGSYYVIQTQGTPLYYDSNHLTTKGANAVLAPFLQEALNVNSSTPTRH